MATITPSFSKDSSVLLSAPTGTTAFTVQEAREALERCDITNCSLLRHRVKLETDEDWKKFLSDTIKDGTGNIDLLIVLKKCYKVAFSMPDSPMVSERTPKKTGCEGSASLPPLMI